MSTKRSNTKSKSRLFVDTSKSAMKKLKAKVKKNTALLKNTIEGKQIYRSGQPTLTSSSFLKLDIMDGLARGVADTGDGSSVSDGARIGNSINVKSITCNMMLYGQNSAVSPINPQGKSLGLYRLIIYNSPCGESLDETHILRENANTSQAFKSHYQINVAQGKMYEIWYDKVFFIDDAHTVKNINFAKKWKNGHKVIYNGNVTNPSNFKPRVMLIGLNDPNSLNAFHYSFKVRYEDL